MSPLQSVDVADIPVRQTNSKGEKSKMSRVCEICGKGPMVGNNISHAHNKTRRRWNPNLRSVRAVKDGNVQRVRVCARCLRSGAVVKAA